MSVKVENKTFDGNRELYGLEYVRAENCSFCGNDGNALSECGVVESKDCTFDSPYPLWHGRVVTLEDCELTQKCRDALWYSKDINILGTKLNGARAVRDCKNVVIRNCEINSAEFGWGVKDVRLTDTSASGEYFMMRGKNLAVRRLDYKGKYAFQYIEDAIIMDSTLVSPSALWHSKDVVVENCVLVGEQLGRYSTNLTLKNCTIIGSRPLCYCKKLRMVDCVMQDTELSFERSEVYAVIRGKIESILNPTKGVIKAPEVGQIIRDDPYARCKVMTDPGLLRGYRNE